MRLISIFCWVITTSASSVFQLNTTSYHSPDLVEATLHFTDESWAIAEPTPITYLSLPETNITIEALKSTISRILSHDDVFSESFLPILVLGGSSILSHDAEAYLNSLGCLTIHTAYSSDLMPGPYLIHPADTITKVYRLYWDHNFAFVESVTEGPNGTYLPVTGLASTDVYSTLSIAAVHKKRFTSKAYTGYPKRVVLPEELWPTINETSMPLYNAFITKLATFLDANVETINDNAGFNAYSKTTEGLASYIGLTYSNITNYNQYRLLGQPFQQGYIAKFGRAPYW
ncbi:hypothetical protein N0V83_010232 [Neocucurbitaria cava]|uniref:Scytalone dehydratase-like protein Arp1 N-terminal domain-containing protein n=1 Tax=Neocucurbitaria cava TaxID=798079 RepID=A0A9W8Y0F5_9PLEO|nr:hypothetical protein N0V83_010232 [Neocucurbitaria cava]